MNDDCKRTATSNRDYYECCTDDELREALVALQAERDNAAQRITIVEDILWRRENK